MINNIHMNIYIVQDKQKDCIKDMPPEVVFRLYEKIWHLHEKPNIKPLVADNKCPDSLVPRAVTIEDDYVIYNN